MLKNRGKLSMQAVYKKTFGKDPENFIRYGRAVSVASALVSGNFLQATSSQVMKAMIDRWNQSGLNRKPSHSLKNAIDEALFDAVDIGFLERKSEDLFVLTDTGGEIGRDWMKKMEFGMEAGIRFKPKELSI